MNATVQDSADTDTLVLCNARSIRNTWPLFKATVSSVYVPSILAITETWLSDDISCNYVYKDYRQFAVSRKSVHPGGGVVIFLALSTQSLKFTHTSHLLRPVKFYLYSTHLTATAGCLFIVLQTALQQTLIRYVSVLIVCLLTILTSQF